MKLLKACAVGFLILGTVFWCSFCTSYGLYCQAWCANKLGAEEWQAFAVYRHSRLKINASPEEKWSAAGGLLQVEVKITELRISLLDGAVESSDLSIKAWSLRDRGALRMLLRKYDDAISDYKSAISTIEEANAQGTGIMDISTKSLRRRIELCERLARTKNEFEREMESRKNE